MTVELLWDDMNILTIEKNNELYFSHVYVENLLKAKENGFPFYLLKQISVVSDELPIIVTRRLPKVGNIKKKIDVDTSTDEGEIEKKLCEYINETECRRPTDKFSIKIAVN